jgi:hypothetical protein
MKSKLTVIEPGTKVRTPLGHLATATAVWCNRNHEDYGCARIVYDNPNLGITTINLKHLTAI